MRFATVIGLCLASACLVRVQFPTPYAAGQLAMDSQRYPARALVHYLTQRGANPEVCDLTAATHTARMDAEVAEALVRALEAGAIPAGAWQECMLRALPSVDALTATAMLDQVAERFAKLAVAAQPNPAALRALHHLLTRRPPALKPSSEAFAALTEALTEVPAGLASTLATDLAQLIDIERGRWGGKPVTAATFAAIDDMVLLDRFATWLPQQALRTAAKRRIIRLRIAASAFTEVHERADAVEAELLAHGRNRVALERTRVERTTAHLPAELRAQGVLVRQNLQRQRAALFARTSGEAGLAPTVDLRGKLLFELLGTSRPVTLCGPPAELDPDPCVDAAQLELSSDAAELNRDGVLRFREDLPLADAVALLAGSGLLHLRWSFRGNQVASIELPIWFETPKDLVLHGDSGRTGPRLAVEVTAVRDWLVIWTEDRSVGSRPRRVAVVARDQARHFHVISRGGQGNAGPSGSPGSKGSRGTDGQNAMCPSSSGTSGGNGGPGGRGGNGGPGGPGGDGGNVRAQVKCKGPCKELVAVVGLLVRSEGGAGGHGGSGGAGGQGGDGGRGGSGTSCTNYQTGQSTYLSGGSNGSPGPSGPRGNSGQPGAAGSPGQVTIDIK